MHLRRGERKKKCRMVGDSVPDKGTRGVMGLCGIMSEHSGKKRDGLLVPTRVGSPGLRTSLAILQ